MSRYDTSDSVDGVGGSVELAAGAAIGPGAGTGGVGPTAPVDEIATVWLNSLTATPGVVRPFEGATVAWDVHAEFGQPRIELNGDPVGLSGSRVVTPRSSSTYRIVAHMSNSARELGRVDVDVDDSACVTYALVSLLHVLNGVWRNGLEGNDSISSLKGAPQVSFADNRIHLRADFNFELDPLPGTGSGKIRASFRIGVVDRQVIAWGEDIDVELSVPWWVWSIPGAIIGLPLRLGSERARARSDVRNAIGGLANLIEFWAGPPAGMALHSARIDQNDAGVDDVFVTACPDDPLQGLLGHGEATVGTVEPRITLERGLAPDPDE